MKKALTLTAIFCLILPLCGAQNLPQELTAWTVATMHEGEVGYILVGDIVINPNRVAYVDVYAQVVELPVGSQIVRIMRSSDGWTAYWNRGYSEYRWHVRALPGNSASHLYLPVAFVVEGKSPDRVLPSDLLDDWTEIR